MPERDPRVDPNERDVVRYGVRYCETDAEVLSHDPRFATSDVSFVADGTERQVSLPQWRKLMANAEVVYVHAAD